MIKNALKGYYFVTGGSLSRRKDIYDVRQALRCGVSVVQYRNKTGSSNEFYEEALKIRRICRKALLVINDRVDMVHAVGADGVHIGQDDMPLAAARKILGKKKIIGVSVSTMPQARAAVKGGADYLGVGPVYATSTKLDAQKPTGVGLIRKIKKEFNIPVVAIGGINLHNAQEVIDAGADSLCAISAVVTKKNAVSAIKAFSDMFK